MSSGPRSNSDDQPTLPHSPGESDDDVRIDVPVDVTIGHHSDTGVQSAPDELPELEDYQLLEELGRGGMGVVYRAKHKALDRTVALKMILGGQFASKEEVRRFQLEAESAARLDHSGIVPIYEVGESRGNHFFSMKLIDGKPLSESADSFRDDRSAVALLIKIAQAVQHAHERGVLHRDLKPANILIDSGGQPMLTDLGLAKRMDDDSGLTRTGLVMGSPGFMSPEQAAGKTDITTAADVYSLGALLFWLITGRPPFQGESHVETIMQTIEKEPSSVQTYRPNADRNLNLICQKALRKAPADRYPSASALANDLQAWLDGEPLSVRSPSALELARIWMRKNFRAVAVAIGSGVACGLYVGGIIFASILHRSAGFGQLYERLLVTELPWAIEYFSWLERMPRGLIQLLPMTFVWITAAVAILMIGIIKPKSREMGMAASLTAGLLAGIVAFSLSLGWDPIVQSSLQPSLQDTSLIAEGMWSDDPAERDLTRRALQQRYPGLAQMEGDVRSQAVYSKIYMDQTFAIPLGIFRGIWLTLCISVLPLFMAGSFASWVWSQGCRGWSYFGQSLALGIYSSLFFLLLVKTISTDVGPFPGIGWQMGTMGGVTFGLWLALKNARWPWQVLGFLIVSASVALNFKQSAMIERASVFMENAATRAEFLQAERLMEKQVNHTQSTYRRYQLIALHAYLDHDQQYVTECNELMNRFENAFRPEVAEQLAKVWLLKPHLHGDLQIAHDLADLALRYESSENYDWMCLCGALSQLRRANLEEAQQLTLRARDFVTERERSNRVYLVATTHIIDALAHQARGKTEQTVASLDAAASWITSSPNAHRDSATNRFIYEVLKREAEGSAPSPTKG